MQFFSLRRPTNPGHPVGYAPPVPKRHSVPIVKVRFFRGCIDHGRKVKLMILCMNVEITMNSSALRNPTDRKSQEVSEPPKGMKDFVSKYISFPNIFMVVTSIINFLQSVIPE